MHVRLIVAGLLAYGLTHVHNAPIYSWQALFLCVGGPSHPLVSLQTPRLPTGRFDGHLGCDDPDLPPGFANESEGTCSLYLIWAVLTSAQCWSDEEKTYIIERLRVNEQGVQEKRFKWEQMWEGMSGCLSLCESTYQRYQRSRTRSSGFTSFCNSTASSSSTDYPHFRISS